MINLRTFLSNHQPKMIFLLELLQHSCRRSFSRCVRAGSTWFSRGTSQELYLHSWLPQFSFSVLFSLPHKHGAPQGGALHFSNTATPWYLSPSTCSLSAGVQGSSLWLGGGLLTVSPKLVIWDFWAESPSLPLLSLSLSLSLSLCLTWHPATTFEGAQAKFEATSKAFQLRTQPTANTNHEMLERKNFQIIPALSLECSSWGPEVTKQKRDNPTGPCLNSWSTETWEN